MIATDDIRKVPGWDGLTAQQVYDWITTPVAVRLPTAQASYTILGVGERLGEEIAEGLNQALKAADRDGFAVAYCSNPAGIDFGRPDVQAKIDALMADQDEAVITAVKELGVVTRSPWRGWHGDAEPPTLEAVTEAHTRCLTVNWWEAKSRVVRDALQFGEVTTVEDVFELLEGEE